MQTKQHNITVYSTPTCPYCVMAKRFFDAKKIPYQDIDVSVDREKAIEMVQKSGQMGVPVIEINDRVIIGFQPTVFDSILAEK